MISDIHQLIPALPERDDLREEAGALSIRLRSLGLESQVHDERAHFKGFQPGKSSLTIYHLAGESEAASRTFTAASGRKAIAYSGLAPDHYFSPYEPSWKSHLARREELRRLKATTDFAYVDSHQSAKELQALGYRDVRVMPPGAGLAVLERTDADLRLLQALEDGQVRFLCEGPLSPDKCPEDVIRAFAWYHRFIDPASRLVFIGEPAEPTYREDLLDVCYSLGVQARVLFAGQPTPGQRKAFYQSADLMISMSEYESFNAPMMRAMQSELPVLAYATSGVRETLGDAGIRFDGKDMPWVAEFAHLLISDSELRTQVIQGQRRRLDGFCKSQADLDLRTLVQGTAR